MTIELGIYEHYKGKQYEVIGIARDSDTLESLVVYRGLYSSEEFGDNPLWVRPLKEFVEHVAVSGENIPRFKKVSEELL